MFRLRKKRVIITLQAQSFKTKAKAEMNSYRSWSLIVQLLCRWSI